MPDLEVANFFMRCGAAVKLVGVDLWFEDLKQAHMMLPHRDQPLEAVDFSGQRIVSEALKALGECTELRYM